MISIGNTQVELRPEHELLLRCARVELPPRDRDRIATLLSRDLSWDQVLHDASFHGLTPLLHRHLGSALKDACLEPVRRTLRMESLQILAWNMRLVAELSSLQNVFREEGIPLLCLKGPALAATAYGNLKLRPFLDLDLLVQRADAPRAYEQLVRRGYTPRLQLSAAWRKVLFRTRWVLEFCRDDPYTMVEVHWELLSRGYSFTPTVDALWERAEPVLVDDTKVLTLGREDHLLYVCLHAAKHAWERLSWIVDVAELIRRKPGIDWDRLLEMPRVRSARRQLQISLILAARLLEAPVPAEVLRRFPKDRQVDELAERVIQEKLLAHDRPAEPSVSFPWKSLYYKAIETRRDKLWFMHEALLRPTPREWRLLPLPALLAPAYYLIRPFRLLWCLVTRSLSRKRKPA